MRVNRPFGHRFTATVYTRRRVQDGMVRLFLRDPLGRPVGYLEVRQGVADLIETGVPYKWAKVFHTWKAKRTTDAKGIQLHVERPSS